MEDFQNYLDDALKKLDVNATKNKDTISEFDYDMASDVSELIVLTRKKMGVSQQQLAEKSGISQANISKIENGHYLPSLTILKRLADALGKRLVVDFVDYKEEAGD